MRGVFLSFVGFGLLLVVSSSLKAQDDLRAVIDKAIKAQGGEEKINKHKAGTSKSKGTVEVQGCPSPLPRMPLFVCPTK